MAAEDPSRTLLLIGAIPQLQPDLQHVYTSIDMVDKGQAVSVESLYLRLHRRLQIPGTGILSKTLDNEAAVALADIEFERYQSIPDELLSQRERTTRERLTPLGSDFDSEAIKYGFAQMLRRLGGVAVIAGTQLAINRAAGVYEDLRQLGA